MLLKIEISLNPANACDIDMGLFTRFLIDCLKSAKSL